MLRTMRLVCWLVLPVVALLAVLNPAAAQGSDEARQACTPDAMRLCSEFIPDVPRITACMNAKHASSAPLAAWRCRMATGPSTDIGHIDGRATGIAGTAGIAVDHVLTGTRPRRACQKCGAASRERSTP